ncbi:SAM-dependent methyltransferase [Dysgonomonas sp. 511]|uniref:SAM-dependent methyltransferase n=1 Tax=Dysgonomonas sp. 511 TaxID=2302930 RepID=UPI0013CF9372|nr:SAM-dependent methyltransferase [Dysgonomonas sp. 511]NDV80167.1 SAM-dependent methyltransferase [Dysgonomonas sp. 511]
MKEKTDNSITQGSLYLIPVTLGETSIERVIPPFNREVILQIKHFIVENIRSARRFLKKVDRDIDIDALTFYELNKHTDRNRLDTFLHPIKEGFHIGIISEAGCPAVADPGSDIVAIAQSRGYRVVPLVGPSSILLSLMASGFNGQSFAFQGYLPVDASERVKKIKQLENCIYHDQQTQIFIETPYRNQKLVEDIIRNCKPGTKLCIAMNITCENEYIKTKTISQWQKQLPDMAKQLCIFLLYK